MEIKCVFSDRLLGKNYSCLVTSEEITKRNTRIKAFVGNHLPGKTDEDVRRISFEKAKAEYFPRGIDMGKIIPNLKAVFISGCGLKELTKRDLIGLEGLIMLSLRNGHLESLPPNLLKNMKNLTLIPLNSNEMKFIYSRSCDGIKDQHVKLFLRGNSSIDKFYDQLDLTRKGATEIIDELLKIVDEKFPNSKFGHNTHNFQKNFFQNLKQLWSSERFSDFIVIVDNKELKVHKTVLGMQSPVFAAMFENDMEESKSGKMTINDFSANAVKEFLLFLYTGEISDETNAMEIFALASKYDVKALRLKMEQDVVMNIDSENAIEVLKLGNLYDSEIMKTEAFVEVQIAYPEFELFDDMKNRPENIEKLFEAKRQHNRIIEEAENRYKYSLLGAKRLRDETIKEAQNEYKNAIGMVKLKRAKTKTKKTLET